MIDIKALFGILSSIFAVIGGIPYLKDIHTRKAHPHVLSWLGWAFITALGGFAMLAEGSVWPVAILFANTFLCISIALYSVVKKVGVWSTGIYDYIFFGLGIVGLILWQTLNMPVIALICALVADFSFGVPTIIKTYKDPLSETPLVWASATLSGLLSLFAITSLQFHEVGYPLYLFLFDGTVLILVFRGIFFIKPKTKTNTIHKVVAFVIQDNTFLVVRKVDKDIWTNLGGKPEEGETEEAALIREIKEELGCDSVVQKKIKDFVSKAAFDNSNVRLSAYAVELKGIPVISDPELAEYCFIGNDYKSHSIKLAPSIEEQMIPFCIKEGLLNW